MSIFSTNRFKNLSAEYVEESLKLNEAPEVTNDQENNEPLEVTNDQEVNESVYLDQLLDALND